MSDEWTSRENWTKLTRGRAYLGARVRWGGRATAPCVTKRAAAKKGLGTKDTFATQNQFAFSPSEWTLRERFEKKRRRSHARAGHEIMRSSNKFCSSSILEDIINAKRLRAACSSNCKLRRRAPTPQSGANSQLLVNLVEKKIVR